jgi:class 3 adenylate cyclase/putative methionine-R-sulfoxide reductase with GAF domain
MTRRPKVGGKPIKGRLPNAQKPRRSKMAKAAPRSMSSSSRDQTEVTRLTCELNAAIERQNATAEILASVSRSSTDTRPVFDAILDNLLRLFRTRFALVLLVRNGMFEVGGIKGDLSFDELAKHYPLPVDERLLPGKAVLAGRPMQLSPIVGNVEAPSNTQRMAIEFGFNAQISVPLIRDGEAIGALSAARRDAIAFTDEQVALIKSFAAQAVIAIENARLLNELRQSLEQQTATAQVLQVISRSTGELAQVFSTILANATRICEAKFGTLYLKEGDGFRATATHNAPPAYEEARAQVVHPSPHTTLWQAANTKRPVQIGDVTLEQGYAEGDPFVISAVKLGGYRSALSVPLLQEDEIVGVISIFRREVSSFSGEHVLLLQNFAAQAVIAIENARLFSDLQGRTKELSALNEQLEQRVADQVGEIERTSRLRRFLPPQVADLIVASGSEKQLESHRREITALFCDLRGFTGFTESADAEDVMALLRDYHAAIGEIIIKYNGTLERYAGDGVMVVFNDPVPVENPALQAVGMALELRNALGALTQTWSRLGHEIGFGIGIAHGFATLGTIGYEGRFDYAAIGTVSNVASRLCDEAKPGQILISPRVLTKVENAVKVEPVGEFELKGIRRPLAAYNVLAASRANGD